MELPLVALLNLSEIDKLGNDHLGFETGSIEMESQETAAAWNI